MRTGLVIAVALACVIATGCGKGSEGKRKRKRGPAPVEVGPVTTGPIELRRTFTGSVRAKESFVVAANTAGRVRRLLADLSDSVKRGQVVAELDDEEDVQGVSQASAELAVARANLASARSALVIATRELERIKGLQSRGVLPVADLDRAKSQHLAATTAVEVARAQLLRMGAGLKSARIRSNYNKVIAGWTGNDVSRVVAERHVNEGDRVTAGQAMFTVVDLEPITVVVNVGARDYASLAAKQKAIVTTDVYPGRELSGVVQRIAPVFREASRQARVEVELPNTEHLLKPGMFVRARIVLAREPNATIVPAAAVTTRGGKTGVFVVDAAGAKVSWRPITVGIRQDSLVQVKGEGVSGRVVTLGHQLIGDGSAITIPKPGTAASAGRPGRRQQRRAKPR